MAKVDAQAQSTYFVDVTGNGCGNNCADFSRFLTSNGISVTSTNNRNTSTSNTSNNNSTSTSATTTPPTTRPTTPSTGYVQYPYYQYTNFPSTDAYYRASTTKASTSYVQYPYYTYEYFQNPTSKQDSYLSGQYPESNYIYYGKDATEQMNKYKKTYTSTSSSNRYTTTGSNPMNSMNPNSGFTITSIQS